MYIHHPDILKFLHAKEDLSQFTNYNISVKVPDAWMESFTRDPHAPHVVRNPRTGRTYLLPKSLEIWKYDIKSLVEIKESEPLPQGEYYTCAEIWNIIIHNAHRTGEPGVVFMDRINEVNPTPHIGRMEATNPCGEQPLLPYEACNLGSINLAEFVTQPPDTASRRGGAPAKAAVDWDGLRECVHESTRYLDNIIDVNKYPLDEITRMCKGNRKIGLGIMGFADALYKLGVAYNSDEGVAWGEKFMQFVDEESHNYSEKLAQERGCFPNWKGSIYDTKFKRPMRNATCTTVAPTGTISIIAGCSGGVEPMYSLAFFRNVLRGQAEGKTPMVETNPIFEEFAKAQGFHSEGLMERIATEGTLANCAEVPDEVKRIFVCAHDIAPDWHMNMQAAFQRHCDASISKTINFPESATVEDVDKIYRMAFDLRCKGVTVYRNGCRQHQPMALKSSDKVHESMKDHGPAMHKPLEPATLPEITSGIRVRQLTPFGNMHINITVDPKTEREMEVFAQLGKGGDLANSDLEAICRMISLWLRSGGGVDHVINQLVAIGSSLQVSTKDGKIMSLGDGLARGLQKYVRAKKDFGLRGLLMGEVDVDAPPAASPAMAAGNGHSHGNGNGNGHKAPKSQAALPPGRYDGMSWQQAQFKVRCPDCQGELRFSEGCMTCEACGFSKC
jgi:ribonucleoside-diphosphate reductase alpha chain